MTLFYKRTSDRKSYMRAYRLWKWIDEHRHGLIKGLPGTGKSLYTLLACGLFSGKHCVFSVPLRQLRNQLYERIMTDPLFTDVQSKVIIVKAHDEVCEHLAELIRQHPNENYFKLLAEHRREAKEGRVQCKWSEEIRNIIELLMKSTREPKLILTTHTIAFMLRLLTWVAKRHNTIFVFDEAEDLFIKTGEPLDLSILDVVAEIDKETARKIKNIYKPLFESARIGFINTQLFRASLAHSIFISATFPRILIEKFNLDEEDEYPQYTFRTNKPGKDTILLYTNPFYWSDHDKWRKKVYPKIIGLVDEVVNNGYSIGIIARNHKQNRVLTELLEQAGFTVWSDAREVNRVHYSLADAVVITVLGRAYRGVSLFTKRNKDGMKDFKVIIGFYQAKGLNRRNLHPLFSQMMIDNPLNPDDDEVGDFIMELTQAKNLQALFRFNRFRQNNHIILLLDRRWYNALLNYAWKYYFKSQRIEGNDVNTLVKVAVDILKSK
jgi:hypothetical protein